MKRFIFFLIAATFSFNVIAQQTGTFKDPRDGKNYKTVKIGNQTWIAENLAFKPASGNYWAYNNDNSNVAKYGYLYDQKTAKKVCPAGWHLPSYIEWTTLTDYCGGTDVGGSKMKSTSGWGDDNNATNQSAFSALPGGYRGNNEFDRIGTVGLWWTSTENDCGKEELLITSFSHDIDSGCLSGGFITLYDDSKGIGAGLSVRCIKD